MHFHLTASRKAMVPGSIPTRGTKIKLDGFLRANSWATQSAAQFCLGVFIQPLTKIRSDNTKRLLASLIDKVAKLISHVFGTSDRPPHDTSYSSLFFRKNQLTESELSRPIVAISLPGLQIKKG